MGLKENTSLLFIIKKKEIDLAFLVLFNESIKKEWSSVNSSCDKMRNLRICGCKRSNLNAKATCGGKRDYLILHFP